MKVVFARYKQNARKTMLLQPATQLPWEAVGASGPTAPPPAAAAAVAASTLTRQRRHGFSLQGAGTASSRTPSGAAPSFRAAAADNRLDRLYRQLHQPLFELQPAARPAPAAASLAA